MLYSSTRGGDNDKSFIEVLLNGLASDGGLYVPNSIPFFNKEKLRSFVNLEYHELCYEITKLIMFYSIYNYVFLILHDWNNSSKILVWIQ